MFGTKLQLLRKQRGLTQVELAKRIGCSSSTIAMYESGQRDPSFEMLETVADFFNVTMSYLIDKEPDPIPDEEDEIKTLFQRLTPEKKRQLIQYARFLLQQDD